MALADMIQHLGGIVTRKVDSALYAWMLAITGTLDIIASPLAPQPPTLQGGLIVDPANVTGVASATGTGTATVDGVTGRVFNSWRNLVAAWGTVAPTFNVDTSIAFASPNVATDPIYFYPVSSTGVSIVIRAPLQSAAAGVVLAGVVAKNRAAGANALLQADLGATGIVQGRLLVNTSKGNSVAHVDTNVAANVWNLTQPLGPITPGGSARPAEVDTWANGDVVNVFSYITLIATAIVPTLSAASTTGSADTLSLFRITIAGTSALSTVILGGLQVEECSSSHGFALNIAQGRTNIWNHYFLTGAGIFESPCQRVEIIGGAIAAGGSLFHNGRQMNIDGDFIARSNIGVHGGALAIGFLYIGSGAASNVFASSGRINFQTLFYGGHVIYGNAGANINLQGTSYAQMVTGTYAAGFTAPALVAPGVQLNDTSTGSSQDNGNPTTVIAGNIGTTVAALDAAQGAAGFGGVAFKLGGAAIGNRA